MTRRRRRGHRACCPPWPGATTSPTSPRGTGTSSSTSATTSRAAAYDHSVKRIGAQFWLGLTATPTRRDGLGELVTWQLGPVRHTLTDEEQGTLAAALDVDAGPRRLLHVHETDFRSDDVDLSAPGALAEVHRALVADESRNAQIVDDVTAALARGRNCLVLTRRVAHVEALTAMLAARGHQALVLQGGMTTTDRRAVVDRLADAKAGDGVLVIGTTPFIGEGFDAPALDTLFLAGPISYDGLLVQCAGRVDPRRTRQGHRRGPRLPRPGHADPRRLTPTPHARLPRTRLHPSMSTPDR